MAGGAERGDRTTERGQSANRRAPLSSEVGYLPNIHEWLDQLPPHQPWRFSHATRRANSHVDPQTAYEVDSVETDTDRLGVGLVTLRYERVRPLVTAGAIPKAPVRGTQHDIKIFRPGHEESAVTIRVETIDFKIEIKMKHESTEGYQARKAEEKRRRELAKPLVNKFSTILEAARNKERQNVEDRRAALVEELNNHFRWESFEDLA